MFVNELYFFRSLIGLYFNMCVFYLVLVFFINLNNNIVIFLFIKIRI